jgi:hypothetical protein
MALLLLPTVAFGYVGPGAGLSMIGSLIAVAVAVVLAIIGAILIPIKILIKQMKMRRKNEGLDDGRANAGSRSF